MLPLRIEAVVETEIHPIDFDCIERRRRFGVAQGYDAWSTPEPYHDLNGRANLCAVPRIIAEKYVHSGILSNVCLVKCLRLLFRTAVFCSFDVYGPVCLEFKSGNIREDDRQVRWMRLHSWEAFDEVWVAGPLVLNGPRLPAVNYVQARLTAAIVAPGIIVDC